MDSINSRVLKVLQYSKLTKSQFAQRIGVSPAIISHISSGRNKVGLEVVEHILSEFPNVSARWLISGTGQMIESNTAQTDLLLELKMLQRQGEDVQSEVLALQKAINGLIKKL